MFDRILVAIDGSKYGQYAADFAFLLAAGFGSSLAAQHVVDPRLVDLFVEKEFAAELGFGRSVDTTDKVVRGLRKMGSLILKLFGDTASCHALKVDAFLDEGYVLNEILKRSGKYDLIVVGHRGKGARLLPSELMIGSIAERVATASKTPVLVAVSKPEDMQQILVAFDGSEPSIGALLMAEQLAKTLQKPLKAIYVAPCLAATADGDFAVEAGQRYLKENWSEPVFKVVVGNPADTILKEAARTHSLLILGSYGYRDPDQTVMGSTTTKVIRKTETSVLIFR
jgi:nucleotide-binding universal stress UspA family protein